MIIVIARIEFAPERLDVIEPALDAMMQATRKESGCLSYSMAIENRREGICSIVERWTDEVALKAHFTTPHMAAFNEAITGTVSNVDARLYDATNERQVAL